MNNSKLNYINWKPLSKGASSFCTFELHVFRQNIIKFKPSLCNKIFSLVFLVGGLCLLSFLIFGDPVYRKYQEVGYKDLFPFSLAFLFTICGILSFKSLFEGAQFDEIKQTAKICMESAWLRKTETLKFSEINGLQLLEKKIKGSDGGADYFSYELNLIKLDGSRLVIVQHGNKKRIENDANLLSKFIGKELYSKLT